MGKAGLASKCLAIGLCCLTIEAQTAQSSSSINGRSMQGRDGPQKHTLRVEGEHPDEDLACKGVSVLAGTLLRLLSSVTLASPIMTGMTVQECMTTCCLLASTGRKTAGMKHSACICCKMLPSRSAENARTFLFSIGCKSPSARPSRLFA